MSVYKIEIPLPQNFNNPFLNCYLIKEDPVSLIDCGHLSSQTIEILSCYLKKYKIRFSDIKRIFLTHSHVDHAGLSGYFFEKYKVDIYIHYTESFKLIFSEEEKLIYRENTFVNFLRNIGFKNSFIEDLKIFFNSFYRYSSIVSKVKEFKNNDIFKFERNFIKVIFLPGHTSGSCGFIYKNYFFSGDVILKDIFVSPLLEFDQNGKSFKNLYNYINTLKKLEKFKNFLLLPGHGNGNFQFIENALKYRNYLLEKANDLYNKLNPKLGIKENFEKLFSTDKYKFFFHFSFYYGLLEYLEKIGKLKIFNNKIIF